MKRVVQLQFSKGIKMKFSIIVPVYNVEKYIERCLKSIQEQSHRNFEVIVVNDGSPDNSKEIIDKFCSNDDRFFYVEKENGGLSDARNYGLKYITGDYLVFIDGDDYIDKNLLFKISEVVDDNPDVIRFSLNVVDENGIELRKVSNIECYSKDKRDIIQRILCHDYVEPAWLYAYKTSFFLENNFLYPVGKIHEDFGLTLMILSKANLIKVLPFAGYYYIQRENSIMSDKNYEKIKKRVGDFLEHHLNNKRVLGGNCIDKLLLSYSASCTITKGQELHDDDIDDYVNKIKANRIIDDIYGNKIRRKLKKIYLKLFVKKYILSLKGR